MSVTASDSIIGFQTRYPEVFRANPVRRYAPLAVLVSIIVYSAYCFWFFSIPKQFERASWGIAGNYLADWISYEARPDVEFEGKLLRISFPRFGIYPEGFIPDWIEADLRSVSREVSKNDIGQTGLAQKSAGGFIAQGQPGTGAANNDALESKSRNSFMAPGAPGTSSVNSAATKTTEIVTEDLAQTVKAEMGSGNTILISQGKVTATRGGETVVLAVVPQESVTVQSVLPSWASQRSDSGRVILHFGFAGRVEVTPRKVEIRHRFLGWENFLFDTDSPYWGKSMGEIVSLLFSGDRIKPAMSNASLALDNFLNNAEWQHADVFIKLLQTIVMAFVGTLFATILGMPLAFIAARNVTPNFFLNQFTKRFFDFLRSVDMLIWALFFTRAFGPGPLAGISAIFLTDTGTLGKLYAEAIENIDDKQREGVKSVGAQPLLVQRYGVVPQVLPLFASQALYFWESNTRSATIIGAVGAGGIGLKLWEAMRTNQDWENVAYMVILILIVVFIFDGISNALRSRLIGRQV